MVDAIFLGLLAIADLALLAYLRHRRRAVRRKERVMRGLVFAVRRANSQIPLSQSRRLAKAS